MPFDPLRTDEPVNHPVKRKVSFENQMILGCSAFVANSLLGYLLGVWPFLIFQNTHLFWVLAGSFGLAVAQAGVLAAIASRKAGLAGACGSLGGAMAFAIFLHLRLKQIMLGNFAQYLPRPEYPESWIWLVPGLYIVIIATIGTIFLSKERGGDE